jgi:hypothetical protein
LLHIIREESLEKAIEHYPDVDAIPERNIARMKALGPEERKRLFPHLFG